MNTYTPHINHTINYKEILHHLAVPFLIINEPGRIVDINKAACDILGYSREQLKGVEYVKILPDLPLKNESKKSISNYSKGDCTGIHQKGYEIPFVYNLSPLSGENENPLISITLTDVSAIRKTEREMSLLINNSSESFLRLNKDLRIISFNQQFSNDYKKYNNSNLEPGHYILDHVLPESRQILKELYQKVLNGSFEKSQVEFETDAGLQTYLVKYRPVYDDKNKIDGILVTSYEITSQVKALKKTEESELRYRKLFNENPVPAWIMDKETFRFLKVNTAAAVKYGYSREEFSRMTVFDFWKLSEEETQIRVKAILSGGTGIFRGVKTHYSKNEERFIVEIISVTVDFEDRNCLLVMAIDITERNLAEKNIEFEKRQKEALINSTHDYIWSISPDYELIAANKSFLNLLKRETGIGYKPGDSLMHLHDYTSNFLNLWKKDFDRAIAGEYIFTEKFIPGNENYPAVWAEIKCSPIYENGIVLGVACYSRDITERKLADEQLKNSEANLAEAQRLAKLGNWHRDLKTGILTWSKELYNITGMDDDASIADRDLILHYIDEKDRDMVLQNGNRIRQTGESYSITYHAFTPKGKIKIMQERGYGVKDADGNVVSLFGTAQDITESKLAEEAIKNALKEKETILESIGDGFYAVDNNWTITYWNEKATQLLGKTRREIIGQNLWSAYPDLVNTFFYNNYNQAVSNKEIIHFEGFYDQLKKWYEISAYPSDNGLSVYFKDITPRKIAEENLRQSNERYKLVAQATSDSIWDLDIAAGKITRTGGGFKLLFGYDNDFASDMGYVYNRQIHPDDRERVNSSQKRALNDPGEFHWEEAYRFLKADGNYADVNDKGFIIRDQDGNALRMIGATRDISKEKEHLKEIIRIQQNLSALINSTSDIIWSVDTGMNLITFNKAFVESIFSFTGHHLKEGDNVLIQEKQSVFIPDWKSLYEKALSGEKFISEEKIYFEEDNDYRYLLITFSPIKNINNEVRGVACYSKDITSIRRSAQLLQKSEKQFSELFQMSPQPMWVYEQSTYRFVEVNHAMMQHYGYTREELFQMTIMDIRPVEDVQKTRELIEKRKWRKENTHQEIFRHYKKNGEMIYVQIYSTPIIVNDKNHSMVIAIDVTEKLQHEQQITRAIITAQEKERYEVGGELHDNVCQLLATSRMSLGLLKKTLSLQSLELLNQSQEYITMALDEIRNISHRLAPNFFSDKTLEEAFIKLFRNFNLEDKYEVVLHFHEDMKDQSISSELQLNLYRILQEQLKNISKYADATVIEVDVLPVFSKVKMRISDNGKGFDPSTPGSNTGIGLANMKRRTELFNGKFEIISSPGHGCEIVVTIPL